MKMLSDETLNAIALKCAVEHHVSSTGLSPDKIVAIIRNLEETENALKFFKAKELPLSVNEPFEQETVIDLYRLITGLQMIIFEEFKSFLKNEG